MSLPFTAIISGGLPLAGDGTIKPSAILDCADVVGTAGQVLSSTGTTLEWITPASGGGAATPSALGTVYGCTTVANPTSGTGDVALGLGAYAAITTGYANTAIGGEALGALTSGCNNIGIGDQAGFALTTESNNVVVGANSVLNCGMCNSVVLGASIDFNSGGDENVVAGYSSLSPGTIGTSVSCSVILGACSLALTNHVGSNLVGIGHKIGMPSSNGNTQLAIGNCTTYWLTGDSSYNIKPGAGITDCAASTGGAGQFLKSNGANAIVWGDVPYATPTAGGIVYGFWSDISDPYQQCGNLAYGPQALETWYSGGDTNSNRNTALGFKALASAGASGNTTISNVAIGLCALSGASAPWRNVVIGAFAAQSGNPSQSVVIGNETAINFSGGNSVVVGSYAGGCLTSSYDSIFIGTYAGCQTTSACGNVFIGSTSGCANTSGGNNTLVGNCTGINLTSGTGNTVLGYGASPSSGTVSNEVTISGGSACARFQGAATAWSFVSDARRKENVTALPVGLDFINDLQPRQFSWIESKEEAGGFIAQEVDAVVEKHSADYLQLVNKNDPENWMLAQANLIPVLVKALQEVNEELQTLKKEFNDYRSTHP